MSLIHWWPLNGDLQDKIQGKVLSTSTWTSSTGGKIGSCYNMNIGGTATCSNIYLPSTFTMACWIKNNDLAYPQSPCAMKLSNGSPYKTTTADKGWEFCHGGTLSFTTNDGTAPNAKFLDYNPSSLVGTWYHLALVSDFINKVAYIYINGNLVKSATITSGDWGGTYTFTVGQLYGWKIDGLMNDLRLYDHALSQAEVKELSRALVVHYTFDDICAKPTANLLPVSQQTQSNSAATIEVTSGLVNGATYTLSTYVTRDPACTSTNPRLTLRFFYSDGTSTATSKYNDGGASYPKDGVERYYFITATANSAKTLTAVGGWLMDHSSGSGKKMTATRSQLEISEFPTPYTPTSRDSMIYNETGLNQPTTLKNIRLTTDSCSGSYAFHSNSSYIVQNSNGDGEHGALASMWIKMPLTSNWIAFVDSSSKLGFGCYSGYGVIASVNRTNKRRVSNLGSLWKADGWNHVVVSVDSSNTVNRCWINGVEGTYGDPDHWTHNNNSFVIGSRYSSNYGDYPSTLKLDDFRLYYTCPSDDEIAGVVQDLYKAKAYITDKSDIETHQFIEGKTKAQATSKYCFEADEFYEELYPGYDVLEYIESTGTQYIDTGYVTTSTDYTYELDMTPTKIGGFYSYMGFMASGTTPRAGIHEYSNVFMIGANATTNSSTTPVVNERIVIKGHFKSGAQKLYKNDVLIASNATTFSHSANTLSTHIFGRNYSSGRNLASMKLYSAKIYEGSTLVRHYIPVRRQSDNALGLYDILTNTFRANSGSGTFTSGPAITNKSASIYKDMHVSGREIIEI